MMNETGDWKNSGWKNLREMTAYSKGGILSNVISPKKPNITLFCMAEGTEISEHTSTKEGIVVVLEGKGVFNLEGRNIEMLPEVIILMKKNAVHSIKAEENTSFLLFLLE